MRTSETPLQSENLKNAPLTSSCDRLKAQWSHTELTLCRCWWCCLQAIWCVLYTYSIDKQEISHFCVSVCTQILPQNARLNAELNVRTKRPYLVQIISSRQPQSLFSDWMPEKLVWEPQAFREFPDSTVAKYNIQQWQATMVMLVLTWVVLTQHCFTGLLTLTFSFFLAAMTI